MWAFCTSHYSGSRSVTRSYSEPSSRCGRSCCIPGTLNESFFSWMKNPSESLLENPAPTALGTFAALFIKSLKLYQFCTWKANLLVISIYSTFAAHCIVFIGSYFTLTCGPGIPCWPGGPGSPWGPYHAKKYQGIRFAFLHYRSSLSGLKGIQTHLCSSLFKGYYQLSIQYDIFSC